MGKIVLSANCLHDLTLEKPLAFGKLAKDFTAARKNIKVDMTLMAHHFRILYSGVELGFFITNLQLIWFINGFFYPLYFIICFVIFKFITSNKILPFHVLSIFQLTLALLHFSQVQLNQSSQFQLTAAYVCISWSRLASILSPLVAYYTTISLNVPIFI